MTESTFLPVMKEVNCSYTYKVKFDANKNVICTIYKFNINLTHILHCKRWLESAYVLHDSFELKQKAQVFDFTNVLHNLWVYLCLIFFNPIKMYDLYYEKQSTLF